MKLNADGSDFFYSTYLGDRRPFSAIGLAFHPYGALIVAGGGSGTAFVNRIVDMNSPPLVHVDAVLSGSEGWWVPIAPGESIVVRGGGFGPDSRLFIGDQPIPITSTSSTEIRAQIPETFSPGGATTVRVESAQQTSPPVFVDTAAK